MSETQSNGDPRDLFAQAIAQGQAVIDAVTPDQLCLPTPCSEFDVATLTNHLIGAIGRVGDAFAGNELGELEPTAEIPAGGLGAAFAAAAEVAKSAMSDDGLLDKMLELPFATLPGAVVVQIYAMETVLHTWDIAAATGQRHKLDHSLAEPLLPVAMQMLPAEPRGGEMPFAAVVDVSESASASDRLAAYSGREPSFA
jgi:uncharacterized protein (TIGR03086 family)